MNTDEQYEVGEIMAALIASGETAPERMTADEWEAYEVYMNQ